MTKDQNKIESKEAKSESFLKAVERFAENFGAKLVFFYGRRLKRYSRQIQAISYSHLGKLRKKFKKSLYPDMEEFVDYFNQIFREINAEVKEILEHMRNRRALEFINFYQGLIKTLVEVAIKASYSLPQEVKNKCSDEEIKEFEDIEGIKEIINLGIDDEIVKLSAIVTNRPSPLFNRAWFKFFIGGIGFVLGIATTQILVPLIKEYLNK